MNEAKTFDLTGGLIRGSLPVIREIRTDNQPYASINHKGMLNTGLLVLVMSAVISKTSLNDAFSPVRRYLLPCCPLSIAAMCPSTTSSTWLKEYLSFPAPM